MWPKSGNALKASQILGVCKSGFDLRFYWDKKHSTTAEQQRRSSNFTPFPSLFLKLLLLSNIIIEHAPLFIVHLFLVRFREAKYSKEEVLAKLLTDPAKKDRERNQFQMANVMPCHWIIQKISQQI